MHKMSHWEPLPIGWLKRNIDTLDLKLAVWLRSVFLVEIMWDDFSFLIERRLVISNLTAETLVIREVSRLSNDRY